MDLESDLRLLRGIVHMAVEVADEMGEQFVNESGEVPEEFMRVRSALVSARVELDRMIKEEEV